jgi:hypothetical protein
MLNYYDRLLLAQYPTGQLFEYAGPALPSDRVGGTWMEGTPEERDAVRRCLEAVFGTLEPVRL